MAFITKKKIKQKDGSIKSKYFVVWNDWSKSLDIRKSRREVNCTSHDATNAETRKRLLNKYQAKEDSLKKKIEILGSNENLNRPETLISDLIEEYLQHRKGLVAIRSKKGGRAGIAEKTYRENSYSLLIFKEFCEYNGIRKCKAFKPETALAFRESLEKQGRSPRSNTKILVNTKQFFKRYEIYKPAYFEFAGLIIRELKNFKSETKKPRVFTANEFRKLLKTALMLDSVQNNKPAYAPVLPLVLMLTFTGARLNEVLSLTWGDVDLRKNTIEIHASKTHQDRTVALNAKHIGIISETMCEILRLWKLKAGSNDYVLPTTTKLPVFPKWAWQRFKNEAEVKGNTPKNYRSSFVSYGLSWGIKIPILARFTGHSLEVMDKHYFDVVIDEIEGNTLESAMGLSEVMQEILAFYKGGQSLRKQA